MAKKTATKSSKPTKKTPKPKAAPEQDKCYLVKCDDSIEALDASDDPIGDYGDLLFDAIQEVAETCEHSHKGTDYLYLDIGGLNGVMQQVLGLRHEGPAIIIGYNQACEDLIAKQAKRMEEADRQTAKSKTAKRK